MREEFPFKDIIPKPIGDLDTTVRWFSELNGQSVEVVRKRMGREGCSVGITVREELQRRNIKPYEWTDRLVEFYEQSDAFMYETFVYNSRASKHALRRRILKYIESSQPPEMQRILLYGDALGLDSAYFARQGFKTSYFELGKRNIQFARHVFEFNQVNVDIYEREASLPKEAFDVVICLDVLEHVPEPPALVRELASYLRPGGRLIVHAPFWYIDPAVQTHLVANLQYCGELRRMYISAGLRPIDAGMLWYPLVLIKDSLAKPVSLSAWFRIITSSWMLMPSRNFPAPLVLVANLSFVPKADARQWSGMYRRDSPESTHEA